ncbi:MAG TPA: SNF2-related protein [Cytophagaceae bacterium]|jgi:hypothetical protein|nr:SNF2-related protein [Cytophagaceae bacterium]
MKSASYLRSRILFIKEQLKQSGEVLSEEERKLLRYGVIKDEDKYTSDIEKFAKTNTLSNEPLSFSELTSYNTWFTMHPEKVCGKEIITTSRQFTLSIKGTKEDIIQAIHNSIAPSKSTPDMKKIKAKAKALQLKMRLASSSDWYNQFEGLDGIDAVEELGSLGELVKATIKENLSIVEKLLQADHKYAPTDKLSFDEVVKLYNPGISTEEIKAWVWYQRGHGEKMNGWQKYFLKTTQDIKSTVTIKSKAQMSGRKAVIKDNHFRDILELDPDSFLGTFTGKKHQYDKEQYLIVRTDASANNGLPSNALLYVKESDSLLSKQDTSIQDKLLVDFVKSGVLFYLKGTLVPYPIYCYANMYDRELQLQTDKSFIIETYGNSVYERQYNLIFNSIEKGGVRPKMLSVLNPDATQRPKILAISKFAKEFHISSLRDETGIEILESISLFDAFKLWMRELDQRHFKNISAQQIIKYYLDGDNISKYLTDIEKSNIEKYGMLEGEEFFTLFLYQAISFEDQQKIDFSWNRTFNGHSAIPYNRVPIGFECSAMFKSGVLRFSLAQRESIAFMEMAKSGIIAYDVGVGKTMSAIITLANNLYSGKCLRPLIVVPNPTFAKWIKEIIGYTDEKTREFVPGVLSNVGYKVNEWYNLGTAIAKKIDFSKSIEGKTITVVTYEGYAKIGFSKNIFEDLMSELSYILNQEDVSGLSVREIEKRNQKYREMLGQGNKGTLADIDTLGFDYVVIDEAHNFKNVFDNVLADESGTKRYKMTGTQSSRAVKNFFLCNYIQRTFGRNVMLLTATPFTNSPLEIYSMLSLVAYNYMTKNGLSNVQEFMESFVLQTLEYVNSYDDTIREQHVVKSFNNRIVLQQLIFNHIAYKTGEDAGVKRPCKINLPRINARDSSGTVKRLSRDKQVLTYLEMTSLQKANQEEIVALARSATAGDGNVMRALAQSLDNAVSPFLYKFSLPPEDYKEFVEESPKIKYVMDCIASVKAWHENRKEEVSGQVVYINRGKDFFKYIKEYLEKEVGYKQKVKFNGDTLDEVEIITSGMTLEKKETIKDAFLEGICKIIIGTASIREGIDLQKKGTVLYNCYPDWNPTDVKQLEGRIWRQGNEFGYVRSVMPLLQDSMDVFVFQKLEEKTSRINDLWYRGGSSNVIDLESIDPEEVKFALFTNIDSIVKIVLEKEEKEIRRKQFVIESNIETLLHFDQIYRNFIDYRQKCREFLQSLRKIYTGDYLASQKYKDLNFWNIKSKDQQKAFIDKVTNVVEQIGQLFSQAHQEDKEILRLGRICTQIQDEVNGRNYSKNIFSEFKMYLSQVRKAEDTILKEKGFTASDNISSIIESYKSDKEKVTLEMEHLLSQEYFETKYQEVKEKKDRLAVRGELPEVRAKEFSNLNYLLSYKATDVAGDNCMLPDTEIISNTSANKRLRLAKAKAKAIKLKLKMAEF